MQEEKLIILLYKVKDSDLFLSLFTLFIYFFADWNMKSLGMNSSANYKTTSDLSMLMGSSCSSQNLENQDHQPKLENFLGRHSFGHHDQNAAYNNTTGDYMFNNCSLQLPSEATNGVSNSTAGDGGSGSGNGSINNNSSIGLSMIKTWLRNQPAPQTQQDNNTNKNDGGASGGGNNGSLTSAQTLSLSMSTGSQSSSTLPLLTASTAGGGSGGESSSSDNNKQPNTTTGLDSQTGAIEAVPRKSIDTFGQRTSIYRGVTRFVNKIHEIFFISILFMLVLQ